ncbi:MAG: FecR family protein [Brevundimonas sp.]|jgi:transmembrane sensor|uniref:FecR family protein n=1 Tax=Brevundimonas sp. TaxID=1871086 RepID=UPI0039187E74
MMTVDADHEIRRREAASWFAKLSQRKVSADDVRAFSAWRRTPANAAAFERMEALWDAAETMAVDPAVAALTRETLSRTARSPRRGLKGALRLAGAGAGALAALVLGMMWFASQPTTYRTDVGERRTIELTDGSSVILDTASRVEIRLTDDRRAIALLSGQALFDVAPDNRPFVVTAGEVEVTAIGTRFDVRRLARGARVILLEGQVDVRDTRRSEATWSLSPGEQIVTSSPSPIVAQADVDAATSWITGRLVFEALPLRNAIAEMNRYTTAKIRLEGEDYGDIRVSGAFNAGDVDAFISAVTVLYPLRAHRAGDGTTFLRPVDAAPENNS